MSIEAALVDGRSAIGRLALIDEILFYIPFNDSVTFNSRRATDNAERADSKTKVLFTMSAPKIVVLSTGPKSELKTIVTPKRILRARDKQDIIEALVSDSLGVFKEIWRLQLFAAHVGLVHGKRVPLASTDSGKGIDQSTFGNCAAWPGILYLIAITEANAADPLSSSQAAEDFRISAFEEYSNGGLEVLKDYFKARQIDLNGLLEFIETSLAEKVGAPALDLMI